MTTAGGDFDFIIEQKHLSHHLKRTINLLQNCTTRQLLFVGNSPNVSTSRHLLAVMTTVPEVSL
ncbi:MAG: hypothetical protein JJT94_08895, partial [Bernardetiaceae bacterium]|nr:hypothetical protein [Bernardetiaceae bacterium]